MRIPVYTKSLIIFYCTSICAIAGSETVKDSILSTGTDSAQSLTVNKDDMSTGAFEIGCDQNKKNRSENYVQQKDLDIDTVDGTLLTRKIKRIGTKFGKNTSKARAQGYGGGIIIQPMLLGLRTKPLHKLVINDPELRQFTFEDFSSHHYQPVLVNGIWLYGGIGNGVRIGFGHWSGECYFGSNITASDSIMTLKVRTGFGGLMLEKVFLHNKLNFITGGIVGAGSIKVKKSYQDADVFSSVAWDEDLKGEAEAKARMIGMELHAGMTVSVLSWWHIGMDINSQFMLSVNGFGGSANSFASANPGLRLRVVFGNLG